MRRPLKTLVSVVLVISILVVPLLYSKSSTPTAHAQFEFLAEVAGNVGGKAVSCAAGYAVNNLISSIQSLFTSTLTSVLSPLEVPTVDNDQIALQQTLVRKEYIIDCIIWAIVKTVIDNITTNVLQFVQTGAYNGQPFVVQDLDAFFAGVTDDVTNVFLNELSGGGNQMCGTFKNDVVRALTLNRTTRVSFNDVSQCTAPGLTTGAPPVNPNDGDSVWNNFLTTYTEPQNTPFGAYLMANAELDRRISIVTAEQATLLDYGQGYRSEVDEATGLVITPGALIREQVNEIVSSGLTSLENADEIAELLSALAESLLNSILSRGNSLLGY